MGMNPETVLALTLISDDVEGWRVNAEDALTELHVQQQGLYLDPAEAGAALAEMFLPDAEFMAELALDLGAEARIEWALIADDLVIARWERHNPNPW